MEKDSMTTNDPLSGESKGEEGMPSFSPALGADPAQQPIEGGYSSPQNSQTPSAPQTPNPWGQPTPSPYSQQPTAEQPYAFPQQAPAGGPQGGATQPGAPYPQQGTPYPQQANPYQQQGTPYPQQGAPYPQQSTAYPQQGAPGGPQAGAPVGPGAQMPGAAPTNGAMSYMTPPTPKKSSGGKTLIIVLVAILVGLVLIGVIATMSIKALSASSPTSPSTNQGSHSQERPNTTDTNRDTSASEDTPPVSIGKEGEITDWKVNVATYTREASAAMMKDNSFNDPAPAGMDHTLIDLTLTYTGSNQEGEDFLFELDFYLVDESGKTYSWADADGVAPDDLFASFDTSLKPGKSVTGQLLFDVPENSSYTFRMESSDTGQKVEIPLN